jgi:hypothetical protein
MQKRKTTITTSTGTTQKKANVIAKDPPPKLPYEHTMEECIEISNAKVKAHFAPKKPLPKQVIPLKISQHFVDMLERKPGHVEALDTDYDRSIFQSHSEMRKKKSGKQVP